MDRAVQLALLGGNAVKSNPNVGCLIVLDNKVIGEGYHRVYGGDHAEIEALKSVSETDRAQLDRATMYVSLEPCCTQGKTPPCTRAIVESGIKEVHIGCLDPNPQVAGRGLEQLKLNGIHVRLTESDAAKDIIRPFRAHLAKRPYIVLKWAQSADFFMGRDGLRLEISNALTKVYVHDLRARCDGIAIGRQTLVADDPLLTVREVKGPDPTPIVFDSRLTAYGKGQIFKRDDRIFIVHESPAKPDVHLANTVSLPQSNMQDMAAILRDLYDAGLYRILVEGGPALLKSFIKNGLWDEAHVITSSSKLEQNETAASPIPAPHLSGKLHRRLVSGSDVIEVIYNASHFS